MKDRFALAALAAALLSGCSSHAVLSEPPIAAARHRAADRASGGALDAAATAPPALEDRGSGARGPAPPKLTILPARKRVYTGQFELVVGEISRAQNQARKLAERLGGYLESLQAKSMVLRVPAGKFNQAVESLSEIGSVARRDIVVEDVTSEFIDVEARLANYRVMAERLRELVSRAKDVEKALKVENELRRVETEIDRLERRLRAMANQVTYATLKLRFEGVVRYTPPKLHVKLPIGWLRELGLQRLLRFDGKQLY